MHMNQKVLLCTVLVAVALNLVLPMVVKHFATEAQVAGGEGLNLWDQMMHMLIHHGRTPVSSSLVVVAVVVLACHFGDHLAHRM